MKRGEESGGGRGEEEKREELTEQRHKQNGKEKHGPREEKE